MNGAQPSESQRQQIANSLKTITDIFVKCNATYRIIGSVLLVAYTNKIFRHINDVDIILSIQAKDCVLEDLKKAGFKLETIKAFGFSWVEAKRDQHLTLTFLLVGDFKKDYFTWRFLNFFELRIRSAYLYPTIYLFANVDFVGIPISSVSAGISQAFLNPKRKMDKQILKNYIGKPSEPKYNNISVFLLGIKLPYVYDSFSFIYNIYGGIRVIFGKKFEVW